MPYKKPVQRIATIFDDETFKKIKAYAERRKTSLYTLAKRAILEYLEKHP